jgi:hypothetical protein
MQKTIDQQRYVEYNGRIIIVAVAMILLPIIFCSTTLACIKVYEVSIYAGKSQEEADEQEYDGETMYIPIDSEAYFYAEIDDVCNPDWKDYEWQFDFDGDSSSDHDALTYSLEYRPPNPPNPWTYDTAGWYYPRVKVGLEDVPDSDDEGICQVAVVKVTNLVWQTYPGNTPLAGGIIFPGKKTYDDQNGLDRKKVKVKATLNMAPETSDNIYVSFQRWDVDDPSADSAPIDEDDSDPDPNKHSIDNRGYSCFEGDDNSLVVLANGSVVYATFLVSMRPGDNYRITATTSQEAQDGLTHYKVETGSIPSSVKRTSILTTWRKLWVELDSMEEVATSGSEDNWVRGYIDTGSLDYDLVEDETKIALHQDLAPCWEETKQDHFEDGEFSTVFGPAEPLRTVNHIGDDEIVVDDEYSIDWLCEYKLKDDDYTNLPDYPDTSKLNAIFDDCYIVCETDAPGGTNDVAFKRNIGGAGPQTPDSAILAVADRGSAEYEANDYWVVYVLSAFQGPYLGDNDPDSETNITGGVTNSETYQVSVIFLENIIDEDSVWYDVIEQQSVVHEIGHQVLEHGTHPPNTIMSIIGPVLPEHEKFSDTDIATIRSKTNSPGT